MAPSSLYIHLPFCASICGYCDFCKLFYQRELAFSYLEALKKEVSSANPSKCKTVYIGGGTPTCLDDDLFESLLSIASRLLNDGGEFTVEANPESLSREKLIAMRKYGVNRLSIGVESTSPRLLSLMGRKHDAAMVREAVAMAREIGIGNLNLDLIYGLPGESGEELRDDIDFLLSLKVPHLSTYSLTVEPGTIFARKGYEEQDQDESASFYETILSSFREAGYHRYEVSNFAIPGFESRHNLAYWHDEEYYGFGLGASGYVNGVRYRNTRGINAYLEGRTREEEEAVGNDDDIKYFLLTNLRLEEGFERSRFHARFGKDFLSMFPQAEELAGQGLLSLDGGRIRPTDKGIMLLDRILLSLF